MICTSQLYGNDFNQNFASEATFVRLFCTVGQLQDLLLLNILIYVCRVNVHFTDTITWTSIYSPSSTANWTLNHTNTKCYRMFLNCQNYFLIPLSSQVSKQLSSRPPDSHFVETGITPDTLREGKFIITFQLASDAVDCRLHSYE